MEEKRITVEYCGERWYLLPEDLRKLEKTSEEMIELALKAGETPESAREFYGVKILKDEE